MSRSSLTGRSLVHRDIAHIEAIQYSNRMECDKIDKYYDRIYANASSTGAHADVRNRPTRQHMPTAHDIAQHNPILRAILRDMQK